MTPRDSFLLRIDPQVLAAIRAWSADELRSVNGQIEFLLRKALLETGRLKPRDQSKQANTETKSGKKRS